MWNREDLAWAAGLFEGEGCFTRSNGVPMCRLGSTDEDVIQKLRTIIGFGAIYPFTRTNPREGGVPWKDGHEWATTNFEHTQAFIAAVWPWLGERRKARAHELLAGYRDQLAARMRGDGTLAGELFGKRATDMTPDEAREYSRVTQARHRRRRGVPERHRDSETVPGSEDD